MHLVHLNIHRRLYLYLTSGNVAPAPVRSKIIPNASGADRSLSVIASVASIKSENATGDISSTS